MPLIIITILPSLLALLSYGSIVGPLLVVPVVSVLSVGKSVGDPVGDPVAVVSKVAGASVSVQVQGKLTVTGPSGPSVTVTEP